MHVISGQRILGLTVAAGLAAALALPPKCGAANENVCTLVLTPPCSPLDTPLRPYFIPRMPGRGGQEYRYLVQESEPYCGGGPACTSAEFGPCPAGGMAFPPETAAAFEPWEFEQLGQIPNDSLFDAAAAPASR